MEKTIKINGNEYYYSFSRRGQFGEYLYINLHTLGELVTETTTTRKYLFFGEKRVTSEEVQKYEFAFSVYVGFTKEDLNFDKLKEEELKHQKHLLMSQNKLEI